MERCETGRGAGLSYWTTVELNVGLITTSLPATKPLFDKLWGRCFQSRSARSSEAAINDGKSNPRSSEREFSKESNNQAVPQFVV